MNFLETYWYRGWLAKKTGGGVNYNSFNNQQNTLFGGHRMHKKHPTIRYMTIAMMGTFILLACISNVVVTSTVDPPSTTTPCPEMFWTPPVEHRPIFYFFLIDGTLLYYQNNHITDARSVLKLSLSEILYTGDRVVLGWINNDTIYYGIEKTIFYNSVFVVEAKKISLTPTFPPTPNLQSSTETATPTSIGQLRQTEVVKTVDAAKQIEQESIQKSINEYLCQRGRTIAEIDKINQIVDAIRTESRKKFSQEISDKFPSDSQFEDQINNPVFESIATTANFVNQECSLSIYSNCVLVIFSDLEDFRYTYPSDEVPQSNLAGNIDIVAVIYDCQFATACETKINKWTDHFSFFDARSFTRILNSNADKTFYNETIAEDFTNSIKNLQDLP